MFILTGTVIHVADGMCTDTGPLYTVKFNKQEQYRIEATIKGYRLDDTFPEIIPAGVTKIGNHCIEMVRIINED